MEFTLFMNYSIKISSYNLLCVHVVLILARSGAQQWISQKINLIETFKA